MTTDGGSRTAVVSQFFSKSPSNAGAAAKGRNGLKKHPSIISLSSSDGMDGNDDDIELLEDVPVPSTAASSSAKKRKASSSINDVAKENGGRPATSASEASKKVKIAPLFERAKNAGSTSSFLVKKEEDAGTVRKLQQWKFAPGATGDSRSSPAPTASIVNGVSVTSSHSSSPLPELQKANPAVAKRRAQVRKMLLGIDTEWRKPPEDDEGEISTAQEESAEQTEDAMDEDEPVASTSKLSAKAKSKSSKTDKASTDAPDFSKFASITTDTKGKKSKSSTADKKGKGKAAEPAVKYTPLEQQVLDIKKQYPDTLLIIEVGYKFKFFGEDAKIAAKELNIACFMSQNFYTAMIPEHRLQVHVKRLIASGHKVGIVRQKETAALKKIGDNRNAPFTRELTDLYTAATYIGGLDDDQVSGSIPTFGTLLCICEESIGGKGSDEKVRFGLVSAQPSTGEVIYDEFEDGFLRAELETRLLHIQPGELVLQGPISAPTKRVITYLLSQEHMASGQGQGRLTESRVTLSSADAIAAITRFFSKTSTAKSPSPNKKKRKASKPNKGVVSPGSRAEDVIDLSDTESTSGGEALASVLGLPARVIIALAGLLQHLTEFRLESVFERPQYFTPFAQRGHMLLNSNTVANLEIFRNQTDYKQKGSLFSILDHTKTAFGQRLLRRWVSMPLLQRHALQQRADAIEEALTSRSYLLGKLRGLLNGLPDLERGLARIHYGKSTPQELLRVLSAFQRIGDEFHNLPKDLSQSSVGFKSSIINDAFYALPRIKPLVQKFISQLNTAKAKEGAKADMWLPDYQSEEITDCKDVLDTVEAEFQIHLRECRKLLKKPAVEYITVAQDEYLLEVRISESKIVPDDWVRINGTKTVYRYRSPRMQTLLQERDQATERLAAEADYAFSQLLGSISEKYEGFRDVVVQLATLDCLLSLALVGLAPGYIKPTLLETPCLDIVAGRHPIVESVVERPFIPNDVSLVPDGLRAMVISGCNMSGKSSYSRMVALLVIMAQIGCRIPCTSAKIGVVDYIGTRFGANDEIARGRSTFMVELTETCEIIKAATARSLVVLDELGRGTSTNDGLAIAQAVLQFLVKRVKCSTLFITHFPQLVEVTQKYPLQCQVFQMAYNEETGIDRVPDITFLYKLVPGLTDRVHGVACARMAGVSESVCQVAAAKSEELETSDHNLQIRKQAARCKTLLQLLSDPHNASATELVHAAVRASVA